MKRAKRKDLMAGDDVPTAFLRGMMVTGLLVAIQDRRAARRPAAPAKVLRHALQGGAALAAGTVAARALTRNDLPLALTAIAAGAAGVLAAEALIPSPDTDDIKESGRGQEEV